MIYEIIKTKHLLFWRHHLSVQNYLNKLGWKKISTKFCHFVSEKNRIEIFFSVISAVYCHDE